MDLMVGSLRVAVVGAGPAGLAALKELDAAGVDVTCFEKGDRVGGIWAFENSSGLSSAYETLHLNTSRARTEFADFPLPEDCPDYPSHYVIGDYFDRFVDHFSLRDRIRFETGVECADLGASGAWELTLDGGARESFGALVVASGHNWDPRFPDPPYPGGFDGRQMHAHDFRDNAAFEGRKVMVVGLGNSAMDIAVESSWVAERTYLSTRHGSRIVPKYMFGKPADQITKPAMARLPWRLRQPLTHALLRLAVGKPQTYGLPAPSSGFLQDHPTISDTILHRITHGEVVPKPGIEALEGDRVRWSDGSVEQVDTIVWCTGYRVSLPIFDPALIDVADGDLPLYMRIFHDELANVFFVGMLQSTGSAIPLVEQQAKLVAEHLQGLYALPDAAARRADNARKRARAVKRYGARKRPAMRVEFDGYMHDVKRERAHGAKRARRAGNPLPLKPARADQTVPA